MQSFATIESVAFQHLNDELSSAVNLIIADIRSELNAQGHNLTGSLSRSITQTVTQKAGQIISEVDMLRYGAAQNEGVKPSRIPFGRPTSGMPGVKSQFISALQDWVKRRGIESNDKIALGIAFAIAKKMKKEGMPTRGAMRFSSNGRRRGFINVPVARGNARLVRSIGDASQRYVFDLLDGVLLNLDQEFENITSL